MVWTDARRIRPLPPRPPEPASPDEKPKHPSPFLRNRTHPYAPISDPTRRTWRRYSARATRMRRRWRYDSEFGPGHRRPMTTQQRNCWFERVEAMLGSWVRWLDKDL